MSKLEELINQYCPDGVEYKTLNKVAKVTSGSSAPQDSESFSDNGTPFCRTADVGKVRQSVNFVEIADKITGEAAKGMNLMPVGTILIPKSGASTLLNNKVRLGIEAYVVSHLAAIIADKTQINDKYLYYALTTFNITTLVENPSYPSLKTTTIGEFIEIPVPPLPVQEEIVRILDKFTELEEELEEELHLRKKQYEYYRDSLLSDNRGFCSEVKTVGELSKFRRGSFPQPYGNKEWYDGEGAMPFVQVADIGDNMCLVENTKRKISKLAQPQSVFAPKGSIIISLQGSIGRIAVTQYDAYIDRTVAIFSDISDKLLPKYFVYQLQRIFSIKEKTARGSTIKTITKEEFTSFPIPVLPLTEQQRIVNILDRFDALCNDITEGLPAEIKMRRQQYEYYRDKLLDFKRLGK